MLSDTSCCATWAAASMLPYPRWYSLQRLLCRVDQTHTNSLFAIICMINILYIMHSALCTLHSELCSLHSALPGSSRIIRESERKGDRERGVERHLLHGINNDNNIDCAGCKYCTYSSVIYEADESLINVERRRVSEKCLRKVG